MSLVVTPPLLWTAGTIFPVVCTAIVGARFAARSVQRARPGMDDWLTLPALILIWGMAIDIMIGTGQGSVGYPTPPTSAADPEPPAELIIRKVYWSMTLLQLTALALIKISCMMFLGRIFRTGAGERIFDIFYWTYIALTIGWFISFFFAYLFTCGTNISANWGTTQEAAACPASFVQIDSGMSYMDLILDVFVLVFPIPYIWRLNLSTARKLLVSFIFFLGSMAILASIARVAIIELELSAIFDESADQDLTATAVIYFMYLEACFGLCATCLPSVSGLTKHKSVANLVAGLSSMLSSLSGGSSKKDSRLSESNTKKARDATSSASGQSETEPVEAASGSGSGHHDDSWVSHTGKQDIEMAPRAQEDGIQVSQAWETRRE